MKAFCICSCKSNTSRESKQRKMQNFVDLKQGNAKSFSDQIDWNVKIKVLECVVHCCCNKKTTAEFARKENKNVCWFEMEIVDSNSHQIVWFEKINVWECVVYWFWVGNIIKKAAWVEMKTFVDSKQETENQIRIKIDINVKINVKQCVFVKGILFAAKEKRK